MDEKPTMQEFINEELEKATGVIDADLGNGSPTPQAIKEEAMGFLLEFLDELPTFFLDKDLADYNTAVATVRTVQTNVAALLIQAALTMEKQEKEAAALSRMEAEVQSGDYSNLIGQNPLQ